MTKSVLFPKIEVYKSATPCGTVYGLYLNDTYEGSYATREDLFDRLILVFRNELNKR